MRVNLKASEENIIRHMIKTHPVLNSFIADPKSISPWVDNNVNDLTDVKTILKHILRILIFLIKHKIKK